MSGMFRADYATTGIFTPPEDACLCKDRRESEIKNSASPISKARGSNQADLRREEMSFELAQESRNALTGSKILWQRIP